MSAVASSWLSAMMVPRAKYWVVLRSISCRSNPSQALALRFCGCSYGGGHGFMAPRSTPRQGACAYRPLGVNGASPSSPFRAARSTESRLHVAKAPSRLRLPPLWGRAYQARNQTFARERTSAANCVRIWPMTFRPTRNATWSHGISARSMKPTHSKGL